MPLRYTVISKIVTGLVFVACSLPGEPLHAANDTGLAEITNYLEYSGSLSSSGQPDAAQFQALKDAGFERVIFLAFSDHHESIANEDRIVKELGIDYVQIPIEWDAPSSSDFYLFAGSMEREPEKKTLVHCQVNFRASSFSFLYRVLYLNVPMEQAKEDLNSVWVPNSTWRSLIFNILEENGRSPHCDGCLWHID
jgi:protein tyrosine phosphatase (PTP) superfamily phosphohydrolase (DUF442 family)